MHTDQTTPWTKESIKTLRLRMGWSQSELAYHLHCSTDQVDLWENKGGSVDPVLISELELLLRQAEACSDEVHYTPVAENQCDLKALEQIEFSQVKADIE